MCGLQLNLQQTFVTSLQPSAAVPLGPDKAGPPPCTAWNIEVFVQTVKKMFPNTIWPEVMQVMEDPQ